MRVNIVRVMIGTALFITGIIIKGMNTTHTGISNDAYYMAIYLTILFGLLIATMGFEVK